MSGWMAWALNADKGSALSSSIRSPAGWTHAFVFWEDVITINVHIDAISLYFILLANIVALAASWISAVQTEYDPLLSGFQNPAFFHACLNGFHFTMLLVPILDNMILLWVAIELTTLSSALVVGFYDTRSAWEAAWKYLIITSAGIVLALLGTMFLAHAIADPPVIQGGPDTLMNWTQLMVLAHNHKLEQDFVTLSFLFILIGYGTKAGLAPMHTWLPDGHGEAPPAVSALLSGVLLKLALYAILRFTTITNASLGSAAFTSNLLLAAGLLSLCVATPLILKRNRFKRVLAYHSVEHMGIICFGLGIGAPFALAGALLHTFNHAVTKALMFLAYGSVEYRYRRALNSTMALHEHDIDRKITGVMRAMPKTAALLTFGGLALVGSPPFGIFLSELMILWGALESVVRGSPVSPTGLPNAVVLIGVAIFMLTTTLIFFGLIRHLSDRLLGKPPEAVRKTRIAERLLHDLTPLILLGVFVAFGVFFVSWSELLDLSVAVLTADGKSWGR
jgi:hydrogenase-4 component F